MFLKKDKRGDRSTYEGLGTTDLRSWRSESFNSGIETYGGTDRDIVARGLRSNWHLLSLCLGMLVAALVWAIIEPDTRTTGRASAVTRTTDIKYPSDPNTYANRWKRSTGDARVMAAIEDYEWQLANDRESDETPANLYRLANLYYSNLQEYEKASLYYESLLKEHPDFPGNITVFPNLAACYERLGNHALERHTYEQMIEFFPPESQETLFAKQKLGL